MDISEQLDTSGLSTDVSSPMQHRLKSPQNVLLAGMSDTDDLDPSDLTIIVSPSVSGGDVDKTVEQTCEKIKLTANNVRSIIRVSVSRHYLNL